MVGGRDAEERVDASAAADAAASVVVCAGDRRRRGPNDDSGSGVVVAGHLAEPRRREPCLQPAAAVRLRLAPTPLLAVGIEAAASSCSSAAAAGGGRRGRPSVNPAHLGAADDRRRRRRRRRSDERRVRRLPQRPHIDSRIDMYTHADVTLVLYFLLLVF